VTKICEPINWEELPLKLWRGSSPNPFLNEIYAKLYKLPFTQVLPIECETKNERDRLQMNILSRFRKDRDINKVRDWRIRTVSNGLILYVYRAPLEVNKTKEEEENSG